MRLSWPFSSSRSISVSHSCLATSVSTLVFNDCCMYEIIGWIQWDIHVIVQRLLVQLVDMQMRYHDRVISQNYILQMRYQIQFSSAAQSCPTLCDPMTCSTPGLPIYHQLPECTQPCPSSQWCCPTISSSVIPFSSCPQSFPASGSFQMSRLFTSSGSQSIGVSTSTSVLPMNTQDWSLGWTSWISLQSKGLSRVFSNTTVQKHQYFGTELSWQSNSHIHTRPLEKPQPWLDGPMLTK